MDLSRIDQLSDTGFEHRDIQLFMKRDDLINGPCQGNKFRKLKYHIAEAKKQCKTQLLSFGGMYSNHLYALAHFGEKNGWETIAVVRGDRHTDNPSIDFMKNRGMTLIPINRTEYRKRNDPGFKSHWQQRFPKAYMIPEGGSEKLGLLGIEDLAMEINEYSSVQFDKWICPFATGCTAVGLASGVPKGTSVWAFSVLKGLDYIQMLKSYDCTAKVRDHLAIYPAHMGGFARRSIEVEHFIKEFYTKYDIILDPIYSGKMMYSLYQKLVDDTVLRSLKLLVIHTGGTQGNIGYNLRFGTDLPTPSLMDENS